MIFVAVGTQKFPFDRLLIKLDELVALGDIEEEVYAQIGNATYIPKNYKYERFMTKDDFTEKINRCNILVTHSGVATIIAGLQMKKPTVVIPRMERYGEHVDNHQFEIAKSFAELNYVLICEKEEELGSIISKAYTHQFSSYQSNRQNVINVIRQYIQSL